MALTKYITDTRLLLNDPFVEIYTDVELTGYINRARSTVATLTECVRDNGTFPVASAAVVTVFSSVNPATIPNGSKLISVRALWTASGQRIELRPYEWYTNYYLTNNPQPSEFIAAIDRRGYVAAHGGTIILKSGTFIGPFVANLDGAWLPIDLVDDTTEDDVPLPWSEAVCYYAAHLAYMRVQRQADSNEMSERFKEKIAWGTQGSRPSPSGMSAVDFNSTAGSGGGGGGGRMAPRR